MPLIVAHFQEKAFAQNIRNNMKTISKLLLISLIPTALHATLFYTEVHSIGVNKEVIAVVKEEDGFKPVTFQYTPWDGIVLPVVQKTVIEFDSNIPSVLIGDEITYFNREMNVFYMLNTDIKPMELLAGADSDGWIKSHILGSIYYKYYPFIYTEEGEWIYVIEGLRGILYIYNFTAESWIARDYREEWINSSNINITISQPK